MVVQAGIGCATGTAVNPSVVEHASASACSLLPDSEHVNFSESQLPERRAHWQFASAVSRARSKLNATDKTALFRPSPSSKCC